MMITSLRVFDFQQMSRDAGLLRALMAHAIHQTLHDAMKALRHSGPRSHILCIYRVSCCWGPNACR